MAIKFIPVFSETNNHYGHIFDCDRIDFVQRLKYLKLTLVILDLSPHAKSFTIFPTCNLSLPTLRVKCHAFCHASVRHWLQKKSLVIRCSFRVLATE